jgi:hypothetical protein
LQNAQKIEDNYDQNSKQKTSKLSEELTRSQMRTEILIGFLIYCVTLSIAFTIIFCRKK